MKRLNSKFEYRNSKQIRNSNVQIFKTYFSCYFGHLKIVLDFGFRASDLTKQQVTLYEGGVTK